jgi:hypothetical protein
VPRFGILGKLEERLQSADDRLNSELPLDARPPGFDHLRAERRGPEDTLDRVRQGVGVIRGYEFATSIAEKLRDASHLGTDCGHSVGQCLDQRNRESLSVGGKHDAIDVSGSEPVEHCGSWNESSEANDAVEVEAVGELFRPLFERTFRAGEPDFDLDSPVDQAACGLEDEVMTLFRREARCHEQNRRVVRRLVPRRLLWYFDTEADEYPA